MSTLPQLQAPLFQAEDLYGRRVDLADYVDYKNVALVFNRGFA